MRAKQPQADPRLPNSVCETVPRLSYRKDRTGFEMNVRILSRDVGNIRNEQMSISESPNTVSEIKKKKKFTVGLRAEQR